MKLLVWLVGILVLAVGVAERVPYAPAGWWILAVLGALWSLVGLGLASVAVLRELRRRATPPAVGVPSAAGPVAWEAHPRRYRPTAPSTAVPTVDDLGD